MIQALKNKIRDSEFVSEILKEELLKAMGGDGTMEEINSLIIRKTLGGEGFPLKVYWKHLTFFRSKAISTALTRGIRK
jgi:hypothetical protein